MNIISINSSTIEAIGYDTASEKLLVKFKNGDHYEYLNVPHYVYHAVIESDSIGRALNSEVKGIYDYFKIR